MPRHLRYFALFFCLILRGSTAFSQDPVFSQWYASPLQTNPAFAGTNQAPFIALNYRMQYPSFSNGAAYSTFAGSYDQALNRSNSSIGISIMTDDAGQGILKKTYASAIYSYKVNINEDMAAKIGVEAGMISTNLDWNKLIFLDQIDPISGWTNPDGSIRPTQEVRPEQVNRTVFDISTGLLLYASSFHVGLSAKHMATPDESFLKSTNSNLRIGLPVRWTLHGGYEIILRKSTRFRPATFVTPSLMVVKQGDFAQFVGGAYAGLGPIFTGVWYRHALSNPESAIFTLGFKQDYFKIGYSYDFPVGGLSTRTGGTHEVSLTLNLDPYKNKKRDLNDCFKMFR
ncbi:MAG: PorP/SprF family type IX secretion system membrane protein [Saprospiraceae bacterium]|nr:PorP/SprF family type IX secretion system membrane protein [Saprospiraceae bacterium]